MTIQPYGIQATDFFYNMMFCDDPELLASIALEVAPDLQPLTNTGFDEKGLRAIADSQNMHPRFRALAAHRLRDAKKRTGDRTLFGVIVEVPMDAKPDTFGVFVDGSLRYINTAGQVAYADGIVPPLIAPTSRVMKAAGDFMKKAKTRTRERDAVPAGRARVTVLASDGVFVADGTMETLMKDAAAGPVLQACGELLRSFGELSIEQRQLHEQEQQKKQ